MSNIEDLYITLSDIAFILAQIPRCENEIRQLKDVATALERLEQLENNIKLNEAQIEDLTLEVANYKHALEEKNEIIFDLHKENQELKEKLKEREEANAKVLNMSVFIHNENEKLKKVIEILESVLDLELENSEEWGKLTYFINSNGGSTLNKDTYELLKEFITEVLEYDE